MHQLVRLEFEPKSCVILGGFIISQGPNPDEPEPKKIGFIFTTKITKEKKNKIYNPRALRVLRGVIKLFFPQKSQNIQLNA
ncbi:MAG: hypothetical protein BA867_01765 [Desulfobacterales bacterium S5133MH16]|nr:MAG: hypothetical protein BA867_01765 [Desulfobacterales bacterium S5133MH16]